MHWHDEGLPTPTPAMSASTSISVVIALYNKAGYIQATLQGVLTQSRPALEIIVVDDGSTDGGAEFVERMRIPQLTLVRQANGGVSRARNAGVAAARADWVAFLDADDVWHPDYLETLTKLIAQHPRAHMVGTTYRSVGVSQLQEAARWPGLPDSITTETVLDLPSRWLQGTCFFTSSVAVQRELLQSMPVLFPPGESAGEDLDLWFRLAERSPVVLGLRPLVLRVWVPGSLSSGANHEKDPPYLLRMEGRALAGQLPAPLAKSSLRYVHDSRVTLARDLITQGRRALAWPLLKRSWRHASPHRWGLTLLMLLAPSNTVHQWQAWRTRRRMIL